MPLTDMPATIVTDLPQVLNTPSCHISNTTVQTPGSILNASRLPETKDIIKDFLRRLRYYAPNTASNKKLRDVIAAEILSWNAGLDPKYVDELTDVCCAIAESAYAHTSYEHQRVAALYTAYLTYVDDLGERDLDAVAQFGRRLLSREPLGNPALERLLVLMQEMYGYYPHMSAHSIAVSTLDFFVGTYVEVTGKNMAVAPGATRYPGFMRQKTAVGASYALFNFVKDWRNPADHYHMQLIPEIAFYTGSINDVLSFYKESLVGETNNLVHLRAAAEQKEPLVVLRELVEETLASICRVEMLSAGDPQLAKICRSYLMGYVETHFRASRYRLKDLGPLEC